MFRNALGPSSILHRSSKAQIRMPEKYTYLLVDLCCILIPFLFSFYPKINFYKQWRYFLTPCILTALFFLAWDMAFTKAGVWSFNSRYVCGLYIYNLPMEECLFFICIPYSCVFTYYCIGRFMKFHISSNAIRLITFLLIASLAIIGFTHLPQLYTSITFLLLAISLCFALIKYPTLLPAFYVSYLLILIPFFISNGILTGSIINRPTVLYNNNYNTGFRICTIPIEDLFYAMLLILMNISGFEYLGRKTKAK